tara:strand:- start:1723 stop:1932 length:210 start_codon:yes stop_codon:yes gene_type:complete
MDKELINHFIRECIDVQDWEARQKANYIEMNEWFNYSGQVEVEKHVLDFDPRDKNIETRYENINKDEDK